MLILAFESSAVAASVALAREDKLLGEFFLNCGRTHSQTLTKMAQELMESCSVKPEELTAVACAKGPGSFTGIRIGMAAAKGFAWGAEIPCVGVSTLEAMAQQMREFEGLVCCAMDARRQQVYHALFDSSRGELTRLCPDCAISLEELAKTLKKSEKPKIMVGDGAQLCYNTLAKTVPGCILPPENRIMQRASGVAVVAQRLLSEGYAPDSAALVPNYLRLSQAERERNERLLQNKGGT